MSDMPRGRPLQFDPDRARQAAMHLFWAHGYQGTSLRDLTREMALSRSSFYQSMGNKEQLFIDCLGDYRRNLLNRLSQRMEAAPSARAFLEDLFMEAADSAGSEQARLGCLIFNSAAELGHDDGHAAEQARGSLRQLTGLLQSCVERAQSRGEIPPDRDTKALAHYLTASMAGLRTLVKSSVGRRTARATARQMLAALQ
ncbi:TetR/AcrR family transcriptional regulator [Wenzhouxiangella sp. EGI_FJ10305]|uniref:TetR/AcrR family transcriptional regulator n=1 Tax=Wenzhouxiangella sp. EGI_FJ10305 TaxID=3243768 RepID=UPI0035D569BF